MVTVAGVTPLLSTESAVLGTVVANDEMSKLPLAIRNWDDLLAMVPGVQSDRYTEQAGGTSAGRTGGVSVHGNRSLQNNFLLDGVANNSFSTNVQELTTQISRPSVDAIQEFKVVTSPYAAEYGWSPGAAVIVNTKSGTNSIRGTAYEFFRNDRLDTINYFAKAANQPKATNNQNQFGGNLGGPIKRNKLFFFGDYEGTRIEQGVLRTGRVLTPAERNGVFSTAIRDPLTGLPFPNNTIPADRFDPVASKIIALMPGREHDRRQQLHQSAERAGRIGSIPGTRRSPPVEQRHGLRPLHLQRSLPLRARLFRRRPRRHLDVRLGPELPQVARRGRRLDEGDGLEPRERGALLVRARHQRRHAGSVRRGRQRPDRLHRRAEQSAPSSAASSASTSPATSGSARRTSCRSSSTPTSSSIIDTLTWLKGRHQWKFGADIMLPMRNEYFDVAPTRGNLTFNAQFTGNAFADFLLGYAQRAQLTNVFIVNQRLWSTSFFAQDDWKVSDALTVNLGLRYDFMTPAVEADNRMANFDPSGAGSLVFARDGSLDGSRAGEPGQEQLRAADRRRLQDHRSNTIVRGGYGVFYNQFERIGSEDQLALNPPGLQNIDIQAASGSAVPILLHAGRLPAEPSRSVEHRPGAHHGPRRRSRLRRGRWCSSSAAAFEQQMAAISSRRSMRSARSTEQPRGAAQPQPEPARHARRQRAAAVSDVRQRAVARDDGRGQLQGHRPVASRSDSATATATAASYTLGDAQRSGAGAPERLVRPAAERARSRVVGRTERLRHPPPLRRQLHRRAAVRRGQTVRAGRRGRRGPRRLAGERDLQRAHRPAVHGHAGQQQRRRRRDRAAEPHRRSERRGDGASSGSTRPRSRRCPRARSATPAATSCADRAGSRST